MKIQRRTVDTVDLPLLGGTLCRVQLHRAENGEPADLVLAIGSGEPGAWMKRREVLVLPGEVLPELSAALGALSKHTPENNQGEV